MKNQKNNPMNEEHSEEHEQVNAVKEDTTEENQAAETDDSPSPADEWEQKYREVNEKYLRLYSEFDNFRKRTQKEKIELYKTAGEEVMAALLPVIDDFDRAERSAKETQDIESIQQGFDLIHQKLLNILKQKGLSQMESSIGKEFDLEKHEAITKIPAPSDELKGKIIDEVERGYKLNDKVIRFSKVVVGE